MATVLVPGERPGQAVSLVFGSIAVSTVLGVPLGTLVGQALDWRATFIGVVVLCAGSLVATLMYVPDGSSSSTSSPAGCWRHPAISRAPSARSQGSLFRLARWLRSPAPPGTWVEAAGTGIAYLLPSGRLGWLDRPEDSNAVPTRMNDGAADPVGRFWAGSTAYDATPGAGSLYRAAPNGDVTRVLDGITIPNGPAFSPDGRTMYLADSAHGHVDSYPVDLLTGTLGTPAPFLRLDPATGTPDGMTVDNDDHLWIAIWGRGGVSGL
ncbi:SMP-30/gluconolactonase/LRE family protein [Streptomyces sp.]|uniref:SMP-30/gluconolactonase/LRE family protein n=1 Tax=Streptomyces sp. TaxID=1931 RepID=UPI002D77CF05|nr:SMP-30/gluconolactonase/LRE family protein [Streptomyces sp.]HET6353898.1 SMP-30/gluconolactonase/LRE family protein [Streptomyces sp.]